MEKPITLIINETKQGIVDALNNAHLHPYFLNQIMKEISVEVENLYKESEQKELLEYQQGLKEEKAKENKVKEEK